MVYLCVYTMPARCTYSMCFLCILWKGVSVCSVIPVCVFCAHCEMLPEFAESNFCTQSEHSENVFPVSRQKCLSFFLFFFLPLFALYLVSWDIILLYYIWDRDCLDQQINLVSPCGFVVVIYCVWFLSSFSICTVRIITGQLTCSWNKKEHSKVSISFMLKE